jgi:N-acetylglucosaminyl-diphospho-decaprenol L-rhamnosyltransferase
MDRHFGEGFLMALAAPATPAIPGKPRIRRRNVAAQPFLSVVIVNFCQWRNTARLTNQLRQSASARAGDSEIVIVDNHSPRHPLLAKLRRAGGVSLRRFGRNHGFARAVNEGGRLSQGEWVLLLNPDMTAPEGLLDDVDALARAVQHEDPTIGIVGLGVHNSDGTPQPSCGPLPTLLGTLTSRFRPRSQRRCRPLAARVRTRVPWATGCALLIRRDCLREINGFDETFFLYYEDVDFCRRAAQRGWKVVVEPNLKLTHYAPLHSRKVPSVVQLMTRHALLTYGVKHWPRWQATLLGGIIWMESGLRQLASRFQGRKHDEHIHGQTRRIVGDVLSGRENRAKARIRRAAQHLEPAAAAQDGQRW